MGSFRRLGFGFFGMACWLLATASLAGQDAGTSVDPEKAYEEHKCLLCHAVEGAGLAAKTSSEKLLGPDLSGYQTSDFETLALYLRKQEEGEDGKHKREYEGSDPELQGILEWLAEQRVDATAEDATAEDSTTDDDAAEEGADGDDEGGL